MIGVSFEYQGLVFGVPGMIVEIPNLGIQSTRYGRKNIKVGKYFKSFFRKNLSLGDLHSHIYIMCGEMLLILLFFREKNGN